MVRCDDFDAVKTREVDQEGPGEVFLPLFHWFESHLVGAEHFEELVLDDLVTDVEPG